MERKTTKAKVDIINIMSTNNMPYVSFCDFNFVKDRLISCYAAKRLPVGAKTIIMTVFPYKVREEKPQGISRYAAVPDYHIVCQKMLDAAARQMQELFPWNSFVTFLDNSPIPEVAAAVHSGLGMLGKNGLLIHEKYGSYVFLGEIVTDLELPFDFANKKCLDCSLCEKVCPTKLCKDNCLSAVNQQKKPLSESQKELIKQNGYIWGCDMCSEVCPLNKNVPTTYIKEFIDGYRNFYREDEDPTDRAYNWRGPEVIKRNARLIK